MEPAVVTPEEQELVLGVRMLARSMARKWRPEYPLETDDLEQAAILELCRSLPSWDGCQPFEWFAWYRFRAGIAEAQIAATWRRRSRPVEGRTISAGIDVSSVPAPWAPDAYDADGCVICGADMADRRPHALYCSPACRHRLNQLRLAASDAA